MGCSSDSTTEHRGNYNRSSIMEGNIPISSGAKIDLEQFRKRALQKHNELRKKHGAPDLTLNEKLNQMAQDYAQKLLNYEGKAVFPSNIYKDSLLGENILISKKEDPENICMKWYNENKQYNFDLNKYQKGTIHFTQLVWKSTKEIGFGFYFNNDNFCSVALYYPCGNVLGEFSKNVQKAN
jgi:hypothetical protein